MKNKQILNLIYEYPLPWKGIADGSYELITSIQRQNPNFNTTVISGSFGEPVETPELNISHIKVHRSRRFISLFFTSSLSGYINYLWLKLQGKVDLVHGHNHMTFWFNIHKTLFGFIDKTPYILTLHSTAAGRENEIQGEIPFFTKNLEWPLHKLSDKLGCKVANTVVCTTNEVLEEATKYYGLNKDKSEVIYDGVNTEMFNEDVLDIRKSRRLEKKKIVLFFGTLSDRNRVKNLVEAFSLAKLENKYLMLIGDGTPQYVREIRELLRQKKLIQDSLIITDYSYTQLPPYFASADLFVYNSVYEGSIQPVLEALSCNVPCIVSGFNAGSTVFGNDVVSIDTAISAQDLADSMEKTLKDNSKINLQKVKNSYSWNAVSEKYSKLYSNLLKK